MEYIDDRVWLTRKVKKYELSGWSAFATFLREKKNNIWGKPTDVEL